MASLAPTLIIWFLIPLGTWGPADYTPAHVIRGGGSLKLRRIAEVFSLFLDVFKFPKNSEIR